MICQILKLMNLLMNIILSKNKILNKITFKNFVNNLFGAYAS